VNVRLLNINIHNRNIAWHCQSCQTSSLEVGRTPENQASPDTACNNKITCSDHVTNCSLTEIPFPTVCRTGAWLS